MDGERYLTCGMVILLEVEVVATTTGLPVVYRVASAGRMCARMRDADVGTGAGPGSAAAALAALACTNAAAAAASAGGSPAASNAPMMPDSTSPEPAVAAHEPPG